MNDLHTVAFACRMHWLPVPALLFYHEVHVAYVVRQYPLPHCCDLCSVHVLDRSHFMS